MEQPSVPVIPAAPSGMHAGGNEEGRLAAPFVVAAASRVAYQIFT
ncbi:hypothetical protein ACFJIW_20975 [Tahibacter sp. UC22_41]